MPKCPICQQDMDEDYDMLDGHILLEESLECVEGHYAYFFNTGSTQEHIGNYTFYSSYHMWKPDASQDRRMLHVSLCDFYLEKAKDDWIAQQNVIDGMEQSQYMENIRR